MNGGKVAIHWFSQIVLVRIRTFSDTIFDFSVYFTWWCFSRCCGACIWCFEDGFEIERVQGLLHALSSHKCTSGFLQTRKPGKYVISREIARRLYRYSLFWVVEVMSIHTKSLSNRAFQKKSFGYSGRNPWEIEQCTQNRWKNEHFVENCWEIAHSRRNHREIEYSRQNRSRNRAFQTRVVEKMSIPERTV